MAKNIAIDRAKRLHEEAHKGHNRWHPEISPVIEAEPMEEVAIETRDASDGQIRPGVRAEDLAKLDLGVVHPLTGPVYVKDAQPGDLLDRVSRHRADAACMDALCAGRRVPAGSLSASSSCTGI